MDTYLNSTDVVDWTQFQVQELASRLRGDCDNQYDIVRNCFQWVRDEIKHSSDFELNPVTCSASEVLAFGTGYCYAKSHLLAALLRANGVPAGFCYQRLSLDGKGAPYCLHGLNAVYLDDIGWYRIDARGNREDVVALFTPPVERLAFAVEVEGESDLPEIWPEPLPVVVDALRAHDTWDTMNTNLPDVPIIGGSANDAAR